MSKSKVVGLVVTIFLALVLPVFAAGQKGAPVLSSISPVSTTAGTVVTLTANGSNFTSGSLILWNGVSLATIYVSTTKLTAVLTAAQVATAGKDSVSVYTAGRFGGSSAALSFAVNPATTTTPPPPPPPPPPAPLTITTSSIPTGTTGTAYSATLAASGGTTPYSWSVGGGTIPPGLTLSSTGAISGTPTASGSYSFQAAVKDAASSTQTYTYSTSIAQGTTSSGGISVTSVSPTSVTASASGTVALVVNGTGFVSGSAIQWNGTELTTTFVSSTQVKASTWGGLTATAGTIQINVSVPNAGTTNSLPFSITSGTSSSPLAISSNSVPGGAAGTAYPSTTLAASGGTSPYTWSVSSGTLPAGLTLSSGGVLSGTPTTSGSYSFAAQVKDSASGSATYTYSMTIAAGTTPLAVSTATVPGGTAGTAYPTTALAATGGTAPYSWSVATGSTLPAGLTLSSTGAISGTPTTAASYSFSLQAKDSASNTATKAYTMTVAASTTTTTTTSANLSGYCFNSTYGPCGDPYEGSGGPPANATQITACGTLSPTSGQYYHVNADLGSSATVGSTCLTASYVPHFTLDLGGHTVNGTIIINTNNLGGQVIFNGVINCSAGAGCIQINGADTPSAQARIHHIAVNQAGVQGYAIFVTWQPSAPGSPIPGFRMDHIGGSGVPPNQPTVTRTNFLYFAGPNVGLDASFNDIVLPNTAAACQGIVAFEAPRSAIYSNYIQMGDPMNIFSDSCRGIVLDSEGKVGMAGTGGGSQAYNNIIFAGQNRAVRVRAETGDVIYNNTINDVNLGGRLAAIHIGECDAATEAASAEVYGNTFYMNGGNAVVATGESLVSANVHDNTVVCYNGACPSTGFFALTDALMSGSSGANLTVTNNNTAALGNLPTVKICGTNGTNIAYSCTVTTSTTVGNQCGTGTVVGQGTINALTTSPCP